MDVNSLTMIKQFSLTMKGLLIIMMKDNKWNNNKKKNKKCKKLNKTNKTNKNKRKKPNKCNRNNSKQLHDLCMNIKISYQFKKFKFLRFKSLNILVESNVSSRLEFLAVDRV